MIRRLGYILGLLFVAACVAVYPLTWGRAGVVRWHEDQLLVRAGVVMGRFVFVYLDREGIVSTEGLDGSIRKANVEMPMLYEVGLERLTRDFGFGFQVWFPLWMPALVVSLFMAWRWRRSRRRKAMGFEVGPGDPASP
jgi:hypothetical protein